MLNQQQSIVQIAERINRVSLYYEFSDSMPKWSLEHDKVKTINRLLKDLSDKEKDQIPTHLNTKGKYNYQRYFTKK